MTTVILSTPGAGTWHPPADCPVGTIVTVEEWSGGQAGATGAAGGKGGLWGTQPYQITPNDVTSGVPYVIGAAGAVSGGNGGNTTWSGNNLNILTNSILSGASAAVGTTWVAGTTTYVKNWFIQTTNGLVTTVTNYGLIGGLSFVDIHVAGTATSTSSWLLNFDNGGTATNGVPVTAGLAYVISAWVAIIAGGLTGINSSNIMIQWDSTPGTFLSETTPVASTITATLTQFLITASAPSTCTTALPFWQFSYTSGAVINITLRFAGVQFEQASTPTAWKSSPGYGLAPGGNSGTTAVGLISSNAGGVGGATNGGGGGAGGPNGVGGAGTTSAGAGGRGNSTSGGLGGTSGGGIGTADPTGGGGGGGNATTPGGTGGAPGGGGGGSPTPAGAGAPGQIRLSYQAPYKSIPNRLITPLLAQ